jgi:4-hydroxybenzoyl-CoA thioesterase
VSWTTARQVEFQHCDANGIVFYPRYFEMINSVIEEFFRDQISYAFGPMHLRDRKGVPTATITVDFHAPSFLEDVLDFTLTLDRVGTSSITVRLVVACGGEPRLTSISTLVHSDMDTRRSVPWTDDVRASLART